jgi:hypothetical protein
MYLARGRVMLDGRYQLLNGTLGQAPFLWPGGFLVGSDHGHERLAQDIFFAIREEISDLPT